MQLEHQSLTNLVDDARATWISYPHLAMCFADFGAFSQAFILMRREALKKVSAEAKASNRIDAEHRALALSRLNILRNPHWIGEQPNAVDRKGPRLVLWIYGPIGAEGLLASDICSALNEHRDAAAIILRIASAGGYVDDTMAIATAIMEHPAKSIAIIDRYAFSGASTIACAAHRVLIRRNATWMAHANWATFSGNADALNSKVCAMRGTDQRLAGFYTRRRRIAARDMYDLMNRGTYLSAEESVAAGVCDGVISELPIHWDQPEGNA